ncbi:ATPase-like, ParA/MinD [Dehalogenimonas lykanthroporepellens BL-DC-9]|nr:ATPase-like, ParA/MinD [Dehalogenimonas lykanthroporepellens BL-DC-9]
MISKSTVLATLEELKIPETPYKLKELRLIRDLKVENDTVIVVLSSGALPPEIFKRLEASVKQALEHQSGVDRIEINRAENKPSELNRIKNVVAVMSGKGGVGKSTISSLLAVSLQRLGYSVGILDADITGPSIPKLFGISGKPLGSEKGIIPLSSGTLIRIMSINLVLNSDSDSVIWRGPLISKAIGQFWEDVLWGELDYLIVDLPPGTSDAALTAMQQIPLTAVLMVTTPQALAGLIVRKAMDMTQKMEIPVLGLAENMAFFPNPTTGEAIEIFGRSQAGEILKMFKLPLIIRLPIDPKLAELCDAGKIEHYSSDAINNIGTAVVERLAALKDGKGQ